MKKLSMLVSAVPMLLMLGFIAPAQADETGVASIHAWYKVGRKTCLVDHFHDGSGNGPTRAKAQAAAIAAWAGFTAWEYGTSWGRYGLSEKKSMSCSGSGIGGWSCNTSAIPCRGY